VSNGRARGRDRELRYAEHLEKTEGGLARRFESGCFDIVWLRRGKPPTLIQVKSTAGGPWERFGPSARSQALVQAYSAGADALLVHWPKGVGLSKAKVIPSWEWPA
jgi:hypothetical protein